MAIQDILTSSWNGEMRRDVRTLLQAKLQEMVEQLPKNGKKTVDGVTLSLANGNIQMTLSLADGSTRADTIQASELISALGLDSYVKRSDIVSNLDSWPSTSNNSQPLGAGKAKSMAADIASLGESVAAIQQKYARKNDATGQIDYNALPHQVLDNLSGVVPTLNGKYFYDPGSHVIKYKSSTGSVSIIRRPSAGIIYADASEGKLYLWDDSQSLFVAVTVEVELDGETIDLTGYVKQSDIVGNTTTNDNSKPLGAGVGYSLANRVTQLESLGHDLQNSRHMVIDKIVADADTYTLPSDVQSQWLIEDDTAQDVYAPRLVRKLSTDSTVPQDRVYQLDESMVYYDRDTDSIYIKEGKHMVSTISSVSSGVCITDDMNNEDMEIPSGRDEYSYVLAGSGTSTDGVIRLTRSGQSVLRTREPLRQDALYLVISTGCIYRYTGNEMLVVTYSTSGIRSAMYDAIADRTDSALSTTSAHPVENRVVTQALNGKANASLDGRLRQDTMAMVLLDSMDATPNSRPATGVAVYCPSTSSILRGYSIPMSGGMAMHGIVSETPSAGVVYWHKETGRAYYWDASAGEMVEFLISGGGGSDIQTRIIEQEVPVTSLGGGPLQDAIDRATTPGQENILFQWILKETDANGYAVKKIIWHTGNGNFIDALGYPITQ